MTRGVRHVLSALAAIGLITVVTAPVVAQTDEDVAQQAAAEIAAARERANDAAEAFLAAESRLALLELDQQRLELEVGDLEAEVAELQRAVETVAINRFVASGVSGIPILTDLREPTAQLQADVFAQVVAESGATSIDDYDEAKLRLEEKREELNENERGAAAFEEPAGRAAGRRRGRGRAIARDRIAAARGRSGRRRPCRSAARGRPPAGGSPAPHGRSSAQRGAHARCRAAGPGVSGVVRGQHDGQHRCQRRRGRWSYRWRWRGQQPACRRRGLHRHHHLPHPRWLGLRRLVGRAAQRRSAAPRRRHVGAPPAPSSKRWCRAP